MSIGHDAAGIIPEGMAIDFKEAADGASGPFEFMVGWCERTASKLILGGTLTSQADGKSSTNALGKVHNEVRHDLMVSDASQLAGTFTRDLIYPLLALNKGGVEDRRRLPRFSFRVEEPEDVAVMSDALPKLAAVMNIPAAWAHDKMGIPLPEGDEAVLGAPPSTPAADRTALVALTADNGASDAFPDQTALDAAIEGIAPADLQSQAEALLKPAIEAIKRGADEVEVLGLLAEAYPGMDESALTDRLAQMLFAAALWGRISAQDELA